MKIRLLALGLSLPLAACAGSSQPDDCQPGDIECADDAGGGGKADGFGTNDPKYFSQHLEYKLASLPKSGTRTTPVWKDQYPDAVGKAAAVWADTYWPTAEGSHNARWQGSSIKSPLEKYDAAYNNTAGCTTYPAHFSGTGAKAEWDTYYTCAGPAAKWQSQTFQGGGQMHDGIDNDGDGHVDNDNGDGIDGIQGWWGTCHAWTPASQLVPEPQHAVTINGTTFEVGDIKAIIQNAFDRTSAVMLGGRCNAKDIVHDVHGSTDDACRDNPGAYHVVITNFLGINQLPLIEDRTANYEVWNQPVVGYNITKQDKVTATKANTCVGGSGSTWSYNSAAKELYEVKMTVQYVVEGYPGKSPIGFKDNIESDNYHYILEVGSTGKVIGGRYCSDNEDAHIDFLWSPTGSWNPSNPYVDVAKVKELIAKSVAPVGGGGGGAGHHVFTASPALAIPDNNPTGATANVPVTGLTGSNALAVSVDITHTYRGDLVVDLLRDGVKVKTLANGTGGSDDNIQQTFTLTAAEVGTQQNGQWALRVVDTAAEDVGTINKVTLDFGN